MHAEDVVKAVLEDRPKEGWFVYRYKIGWGVLGLVFRLFYLVLFGGVVWVFSLSDPIVIWLILVSALPAFIALLFVVGQILTLLYAGKSMVILTHDEIVKSFRGKIAAYKYAEISNLRITRTYGTTSSLSLMPQHFVEFTDKKTGQIVEIAKNRQFGLAQDIFSVLESKLN